MSQTILLAVTGSIAAYKSVDIASELTKSGFNVKVLMTKSALKFTGSLTFATLTKNQVYTDKMEQSEPLAHINLSREADLILVAPCSANIIGKLANGIADDLLSTTLLASNKKIIMAPAMNVKMYENSATQSNISTLKLRGVEFIEPEVGKLACDEEGFGRLASLGTILSEINRSLGKISLLKGKKVLVTTGSVREPIDDVRFIGNYSSGKMGIAIAESVVRSSGELILVAAHTEVTLPSGIGTVLRVSNSKEMEEAVCSYFETVDIAILAAAVADFRPKEVQAGKIKKGEAPLHLLELAPNRDIAMRLGKLKQGQLTVGFAAESSDFIENGVKKLRSKNFDMIVVNDISRSDIGFGSDYNEATIIFKDGEQKFISRCSKDLVADAIVENLQRLLG